MRLVTYRASHGGDRAGVVFGDCVVDIGAAHAALVEADELQRHAVPLPTELAKLVSVDEGLQVTRQVVSWLEDHPARDALMGESLAIDLATAELRPPVPTPGKIICVGRNYALHVKEGGADLPKRPELFAKFANTLIGQSEPILMPDVSDQLDYEAELAVVIGRRARRLSREHALDCVLGYTIANDVSVRDYQMATSQWLAGKTMDRTTPLGPWIVTADEIGDPQQLTITLDIDGERLQHASTSAMIFPVAEVLVYLTSFLSLEPGDIILTGTPEGVGLARKPPRWLRAGETVTVEIQGIGRLSNPVSR
jgi:acylpyruvate hydrolase